MNKAPPEDQVQISLRELAKLRAEFRAKEREAKVQLQEDVRSVASISNREERLRIVRDLYWNHEEIRSIDLVIALLAEWDGEAKAPRSAISLEKLGHKYAPLMREMCGPIGHVKCRKCNSQLPITSRTAKKDLEDHGSFPACEECRRANTWSPEQYEEHKRLQEEGRRKSEKRYAELVAASGLGAEELSELFMLMAGFSI